MKFFLLLLIVLIFFGCGAEVRQEHDAKAELVISYPAMDRCFDLMESRKIDVETFLTCLEETSSHELVIGGEAVITMDGDEILIEDLIGE